MMRYLTSILTLYPGDVISSGTPDGVGAGRKPPEFLKPGDVVTIEIDGIGTLRDADARERHEPPDAIEVPALVGPRSALRLRWRCSRPRAPSSRRGTGAAGRHHPRQRPRHHRRCAVFDRGSGRDLRRASSPPSARMPRSASSPVRTTTTIDLHGQTVIPGLADGHLHDAGGGPGVDLSRARVIADMLAAVAARVDAEPSRRRHRHRTATGTRRS